MTNWTDFLITLGVQHLWQSALLLLAPLFALKVIPLRSGPASLIWTVAFAIASLLPLAVFLPASPESGAPSGAAAMYSGAPVSAEYAGTNELISLPVGAPSTMDTLMASALSAAIIIWLLGFAWALFRLLLGWREARRLHRSALPADDIERLFATELKGKATVRVSDEISSPMVVGVLRQTILVPLRLLPDLPGPVLRDIMRHEIAHVRRHDVRAMLAQRLFLAIYWWSPFLRLIGARLDLAHEMACDEKAALQCGNSRGYAQSLVQGAGQMLRQSDRDRHLLASSIFRSRGALSKRIDGLLTFDTTTVRSEYRPALAISGIVFTVGMAMTLSFTPRLGQLAVSLGAAEAQAAPITPRRPLFFAIPTAAPLFSRKLGAGEVALASGLDNAVAPGLSQTLSNVHSANTSEDLNVTAIMGDSWQAKGEALALAHSEAMAALTEDWRAKSETLRVRHAEATESMIEDWRTNVEATRARHAKAIAATMSEDRRIAERAEYAKADEAFRARWNANHEANRVEYAAASAAMREDWRTKSKAIQVRYEKGMAAIIAEWRASQSGRSP